MTSIAKTSGFLPIISALIGNAIICSLKFTGFFITGSSALFSEAIHSLADTANQSLLMIGVKKSLKKPDKYFPYGYGRERFVWALISACGIFFIGCGITVYHGVTILLQPEHLVFHPIIFYVLGIALIVESFTCYLAYRDLKNNTTEKKFRKILHHGDPATIAVLYEDGLAVLGVLIAFSSVVLTYFTKQSYWDALGSIIIGLLLGVAAIILISKNRDYLLTRSIPKEIEAAVIEMLKNEPTIEKVLDFKSSVIDINKYLIKCEIEFNASALIKNLERNGFLEKEYLLVSKDYESFMKFCVEYMDRVPRMIGSEIDQIEKRIHKEFPQIAFIDIEIN